MADIYRTRLITKDTITHFQELLYNETWDSVYLNDDVNGSFNAFLNTFLNISEAGFPVIYTNNVTNNGWIQKALRYPANAKKKGFTFLVETVMTQN